MAARDERPDLLGMTWSGLGAWLEQTGLGPGVQARLFRALHREMVSLDEVAGWGRRFAAAVDGVRLAEASVDDARRSEDGTEKLALRLSDGSVVEAVLVPMPLGRTTLCVSTQVGCAMACAFCATGTLGLLRSLTAGEVIAQVHAARRHAAAQDRVVSRLVFMGMGEPLHAYEATRDAVAVLTDGRGAGFGSKAVTVSTVGLVEKIAQLADDTQGKIQLALSLHAGTDATRRRILPAARHADLATLRATLGAWPLPGSRALMVEYVVLPGVNDGDDDLDGVAAFMHGLRGIVNLIPFNPFPGAPFRSPTEAEVVDVHRRLTARGVFCRVRWPRGREASGACGQLALAHDPEAPRRRAAAGA